MHMKMLFEFFWLGCATFVVATMVCFSFFLHVSTLWFVIPQFAQCLLVFLVLLCVFCWYCLFDNLWYWKCTPCFYSCHTFFTQHCCVLMLL
jgi:hypothetical protein